MCPSLMTTTESPSPNPEQTVELMSVASGSVMTAPLLEIEFGTLRRDLDGRIMNLAIAPPRLDLGVVDTIGTFAESPGLPINSSL